MFVELAALPAKESYLDHLKLYYVKQLSGDQRVRNWEDPFCTRDAVERSYIFSMKYLPVVYHTFVPQEHRADVAFVDSPVTDPLFLL